jgi:hypothetical protein
MAFLCHKECHIFEIYALIAIQSVFIKALLVVINLNYKIKIRFCSLEIVDIFSKIISIGSIR